MDSLAASAQNLLRPRRLSKEENVHSKGLGGDLDKQRVASPMLSTRFAQGAHAWKGYGPLPRVRGCPPRNEADALSKERPKPLQRQCLGFKERKKDPVRNLPPKKDVATYVHNVPDARSSQEEMGTMVRRGPEASTLVLACTIDIAPCQNQKVAR